MSAQPDAYVVPASEALTVLHRKGEAPDRPVELTHAEPVTGWTACCGRPMLLSETWVPIDRRDGDSLCGGDEEAEATLW
jgi:hypothetical protein